ncbi:MAG: flagellar basal body rod protein FlgB [Rhizobiaceae bacterium]|nr:flagellar basal body rod protein FlgB [Rhizobiaceae bacterium]
MELVNLFQLANQQSRWLSVRQATIAGNVANANTPGYGAKDVQPFEKILDNRRVALAATQQGHLGGDAAGSAFGVREQDPSKGLTSTSNSVHVEDELVKAGEVRRSYELNTAIVKSFHRMMMMTTKV